MHGGNQGREMQQEVAVQMPIRLVPALLALLLLGACLEDQPGSGGGTVVSSEQLATTVPPPASGAEMADAGGRAPAIETPEVQIAYAYSLQFRLPPDRLAAALDSHVAMCDALGAGRCRIVSLNRSGEEGQFLSASLQLQVAASEARAFADGMESRVGEAGGRTIARGQEAEDLGRQIVDVEARIAAKRQLADRLRALIDRPGAKVGELVEAERAFADAQAELDSARSQLELMQRRVAMSRIDAGYQSSAPEGSGALAPIRSAFASAGQTLGASIGAVITFVVLALPWVLLLAGAVLGIRALRRRRALPQRPPGD
jgi:hypothetical protein